LSSYDEDLGAQERSRQYKEQLQYLMWERDPMLLILRGHLYVEQSLNYLLCHKVPSEVFTLLNLPFKRKLDLARDLKLIEQPTYAASDLLNQYRDRLAHNLDGVVGEVEAENFYTLLERNGVFEGSQMKRSDDPMAMVTLSRCIRALYAVYSTETVSIQSGRRFKGVLGPWVTEEIDKDSFDQMQREDYDRTRGWSYTATTSHFISRLRLKNMGGLFRAFQLVETLLQYRAAFRP
jgi:hypothetical protein